ncbi:hypothetical protein NA78x_006211 [Anatilimnocola sp. NA78]|uniref:hypothetical protein n=1 Tax=Anatilimnocola sp. NA78 TaxID=3415683 RepID=UPI003CE5AE0A
MPFARRATTQGLGCFLLLAFWSASPHLALMAADGREQGLEPTPHWLWQGDDPTAEIQLQRRFKLDAPISTAQLKVAADFCRATIEINGQPVLAVAPYCQLQTLDVTRWLQRGENELIIRARPVPGPAAVAMSLAVKHPTSTTHLVTDQDWSAEDLGPVLPELWNLGRRGIELSPFENYEQWQQAKTDSPHKTAPKFWTAPGFEIDELRVAHADEGSWISLIFDPQGRLLISREDQGLLRMTLAADRKSVEKVEPIASSLKEIRGLVVAGDWLIANANNSKGIYRFQIDDAGKVRHETLLREFPGNVGHGRNDLAVVRVGDQDVLYPIQGDSVDVPREHIRDFTSPLNESKRKDQKREGFLLRTDSAGQNWELLSAGMRNPYGIAIHSSGEPFTFDADNEFDMGMPWYRPTRILQLLAGGDAGYRESTGKFPPRFHDQPDNAPPLLDIGRSSPTSVMFGYQLNFPDPYRQALFALDWTYGRVIAVHLAPRGASYRAAAELFLQGRPLNVTDVAAGPDGDMYLITGGRKTQSALYRVRYSGQLPQPIALGKHETQAREHAALVRTNFRTILNPSTEPPTFPELVSSAKAVTTDDPVLSYACRLFLECQPTSDWEKWVAKDRSELLLLSLSLAQARRAEDAPELLRRVLRRKLSQLDLSAQFTWLRIVQLCHEQAPEVVAQNRMALQRELQSLAQQLTVNATFAVAPAGTSDELRRRVALLMGELESTELPPFAAQTLLVGSVQEDQLAGLLALRNTRAGWTPETRRTELLALNNIPRMIGGAGLPPFEKWLRPQILATLSEDEKKAFADLLEPKPEPTEPLPPPRPHVQKWMLEELASLYNNEASPGDAKLGATIFRDALCVRCHRVGLRGAAVGPELTQVSRRFSKRDLLESIVLPNLSVAENYRLETILTDDGKSYTGRVVAAVDYRSEKLTFNTDPLRPELTVEIDKKQISAHRPTETSPMPSGLLDTFSRDEIRHLLAYLLAGQ